MTKIELLNWIEQRLRHIATLEANGYSPEPWFALLGHRLNTPEYGYQETC